MKLATLKKLRSLLFCLLIGFSIAACGGGGSNDSPGQVGTVGVSLTDNAGLPNRSPATASGAVKRAC